MVFLSSEVNDTGQRKCFKTQCTKKFMVERKGHKTAARRTAKRRTGMLFFISQVTQRKAVKGSEKGVLTITLAPCKGKPMSGMHTAIQVKSEERAGTEDLLHMRR